jgi:hypothetical protein
VGHSGRGALVGLQFPIAFLEKVDFVAEFGQLGVFAFE